MFVVTQDIYYAEMAEAVYDDLRASLLAMERNDCQRIEFLPVEVMRLVCRKLNKDADLVAKAVEAYVLAERESDQNEIESGALIEKRNRANFGVLVAFLPQGLRLPAEDSYDIQTFRGYDLGGVLSSHVRRIVAAMPEEQREIVGTVLAQPCAKRQPVSRHLKYVLAVRGEGGGWHEAGAHLYHLGLIPDLGLSDKGVETRIDRNSHCVMELSNPDQTALSAIEDLVNEYGLDPEENQLRQNLVAYLRNRNTMDTEEWLRPILEDEIWRRKLSFDKWKFRDIVEPGEVEVLLEPLRDPKTGTVVKGLEERGTSLVATTDARSPIHLKWATFPRRPENLGHYLVLVVKDSSDSDAGGELTRKTVKAGRQSLKVSLKDVELDEGETCAARILIHAKDHAGVILASDETESFYIEGGLRVEDAGKKVKKVRNRAEAVLLATLSARRVPEVDSESWEEGRPRMYRIKLKTRDIYRIIINATLYEIEHKNLVDPLSFGAWKADMRDHGVLEVEDLTPVEISLSGLVGLQRFFDARRHLFNRFQDCDPAGVVETLDLREFEMEILAYVSAYSSMLDELRVGLEVAKTDGEINNLLNASHLLSRIDTLHLKVGSAGVTEDTDEVVLLAPTHPLRMLWVLQYQLLLFAWAAKLDGVSAEDAVHMLNRDSIDRITSLNIPSALSFGQHETYINTDNVDLYWSLMPKGSTADVRKVVSLVSRLLEQKGGGEITSITPVQLADKIWRYLKHHPYVSTLRVNVINPGDGRIILDTIRELQKSDEFSDLNYDVAFYGDLRYEVMGSAFDDLTEEVVLSEGSQRDVDEALLKPNRNPLFPKLTFSKQRVHEADWKDLELREAHITLLIDRFSTRVLMRPTVGVLGSFCLHNLLAEYRADFDLRGTSATWSRKIIPNQNSEIADEETSAEHIFRSVDGLLRASACFHDWGNSLDKVPTIQLELTENDKRIISRIHECSDWVLTIDRNFGIEYFDNPRSAGGTVRSYLIDYTPEFLEGVGHRLIVSTFRLSEIEGLIQDGLRKMEIPGTGFHAAQILDVLKSISGRLALKLINNPNDAREIIGLALTRLLLERNGSLRDGILVPVDSHTDLFAEHKRQFQDSEIRLHRSDLLLAHVRNGHLALQLIEVKFRSGAGSPSEEVALKEAIAVKNSDTQEVLESRFVPREDSDRFDREILNKQFADLLQFYFDRARRHGLLDVKDVGADAMQEAIHAITNGKFDVKFEKVGFIYNLQGTDKIPESYKGNEISVIGRETIHQLLEIPIDIQSPPVQTEPSENGSSSACMTEEPGVSSESTSTHYPEKEKTEIVRMKAVAPTDETIIDAHAPDRVAEESTKVVQAKPSELRVRLGINCDTKKDVYWDPFTSVPKKLANQHVLIVGKSGAGKTQSAAAFVAGLWQVGVPSLIFDFQGEYMDHKLANGAGTTFVECTEAAILDAADGIAVNPLDVPDDPQTGNRQNYMKVVYQVSTSLAKIFGLGDIQHAILREAIGQAFIVQGFVPGNRGTWNNTPPTLSQVWEILRHFEQSQGGSARNLNRRIQPLFETGVFLEGRDASSFGQVLARTSVIRLSNLATPELMVAVSRFVLQKVYSTMLSRGPSSVLRLFAVVDEAHRLSYDETLTELIREARKYGVGILLASQSVRDFDRIVFDMVGTKIALQVEGEDARVMADNLGVTEKSERDVTRGLLLSQPPHRALIRSNHFEPYIQADLTPFWRMGS